MVECQGNCLRISSSFSYSRNAEYRGDWHASSSKTCSRRSGTIERVRPTPASKKYAGASHCKRLRTSRSYGIQHYVYGDRRPAGKRGDWKADWEYGGLYFGWWRGTGSGGSGGRVVHWGGGGGARVPESAGADGGEVRM